MKLYEAVESAIDDITVVDCTVETTHRFTYGFLFRSLVLKKFRVVFVAFAGVAFF
jgi:hypothetical protein